MFSQQGCIGHPKFKYRGKIEIYNAKDGLRWRAVVKNGNIVAESGEAYTRFGTAKRMAKRYGPILFEIVDDRGDTPIRMGKVRLTKI